VTLQEIIPAAHDLGITVHTIGVGEENNGSYEFDEAPLKALASATKGEYFHARDLDGLSAIYDRISELSATEASDPPATLRNELFPSYLFIAFIAFICAIVIHRKIEVVP
jgi:Ca-activated chloride channel family protein